MNLPTIIGQVFIHSYCVAIENVQEREVPPHEGQTPAAIWWKEMPPISGDAFAAMMPPGSMTWGEL